MSWIRNLSIRRKLSLIILLTSSAALLLSGAVFAIYDLLSFRQSMIRELSTLAAITGSNSTAALIFNDPGAAREVLGSLRAEKQIVSACIYSRKGEVFAKYRRGDSDANFEPPAPQAEGIRFGQNHLLLFRRIVLNGEPIGAIYLEEDLEEMRARFVRYGAVGGIVLLGSILVAFFLSAKLQKIISGPIFQLAHTALIVSLEKDYSLRATKQSGDELGLLVDQFNSMMGEIQARDAQLQAAQQNLEKRVEERTEELQTEVNERIQTELKLQSSLKELRDLESALDQHCIVARTDPNGIITFANEKFCTVSKYSPKELMGRDHRIVSSGFHSKEFIKGLWKTIQGGQVWKAEVKNRAKDGTFYWTDTTIVPFCDVQGNPRQYIAIRTDITAMKQVEEDLRRAKETAEAASRAKSEFLANMSHEIRTPLNGVMGMTDLALATRLSAEQREYLETVKMSADSLLTVINDILDFSKIEAGKIDLEAVDFNLRDCLEITMKTLALRADEKGLELLCEIASEVPEVVRGDSSRLRQVLTNLVGNAIKFTSQGEVVLKASLESQEGDARILHFVVSDTGMGISPEKKELIFQAFVQADTSTTRKYGGTGLGLTISLRLVELMGGKIWVNSEVGRGSEFHFTARLAAAKAKPSETGAPERPEILRGVKVLVVDDNQTNRRILEGMLRHWEMKPNSAEGGEAALAELAAAREAGEPYSLILMDMHMPKMDGFTLVERIRRKPELSTATIMMLTSAGQRGDAARCQELGVAAYLLKPIRQSELRGAIARVLGAREQRGAVPLLTRYSLQDAREPSGSLRVLLAEDNPVNQRLAERLLEKRGHSVVVASNGRDALAAFENGSFDLILMDVQMPEMDGFEATAAIREKEKESGDHLPIVALTAHAMKGDREKCLAGGMDGYLSKPIRPQELDEILNEFLTRRMEAVRAPEEAPSKK